MNLVAHAKKKQNESPQTLNRTKTHSQMHKTLNLKALAKLKNQESPQTHQTTRTNVKIEWKRIQRQYKKSHLRDKPNKDQTVKTLKLNQIQRQNTKSHIILSKLFAWSHNWHSYRNRKYQHIYHIPLSFVPCRNNQTLIWIHSRVSWFDK